MANWDSGYLDLTEVQEILQFFLKAAGNDLIGMDVVGDWSPVQTSGVLRHLLDRFHHPRRTVDPEQARLCNEHTNTLLLRFLNHDPIAESLPVSTRVKNA